MITSWQVSPGTSRPCHSESVPKRQVCGSSTNCLASSGSWASPWASVVRWGSARAHRLGRGLRGAAGREQAERAAVEGVDEVADLVELRGAEAVAAGLRQVAGDVEDRLLAVVEGRADVDALPRQRVVGVGGGDLVADPLGGLEAERGGDGAEVAAEHQRRAGEDDGLVGEQLVAHRAPHLQRRDVEPGREAVAGLAQPQHVGLGAGRHPLGVDEDLLHHALGLGAAGVGLALAAGLARERRQARARRVAHEHQGVGELVGHLVDAAGRGRLDRLGELLRRRPRGRRPGRRHRRSSAWRGGRPARCRTPPSSSVAAWVTRAVSSWASSMTTVS